MAEVNQQLIAERLRISRATVSRCFTNHPGINPLTRARVFQVAAEIGYTHLEMRTSKSKKKPAKTTFGVLICSEEEEYYRTDYQNPSEQILAGVTECAHLNEAGVEVHLVDPKARSLDDPSYTRIEKLRRRWSGLLLVYPFPEPVLEQLAPLMPMVSLVEQFDHTGIDCVDADHYKGISVAIEHLLDHGHRRIGFFTWPYEVEASWSYRRYAAFMEKMVRLRIPVSPKDIISVFPSQERNEEERIEYAAERTCGGVTAGSRLPASTASKPRPMALNSAPSRFPSAKSALPEPNASSNASANASAPPNMCSSTAPSNPAPPSGRCVAVELCAWSAVANAVRHRFGWRKLTIRSNNRAPNSGNGSQPKRRGASLPAAPHAFTTNIHLRTSRGASIVGDGAGEAPISVRRSTGDIPPGSLPLSPKINARCRTGARRRVPPRG